MSEAINAHKRMAMGLGSGNQMKKGGVARFAEGGKVMPESKVANLPSVADKPIITKGTGAKIATMKRGGGTRGR